MNMMNNMNHNMMNNGMMNNGMMEYSNDNLNIHNTML